MYISLLTQRASLPRVIDFLICYYLNFASKVQIMHIKEI
uniref:Uncharacterized protein n=1 Tax=Siphoviridae sp. ctK0l2 TaxID=2826243 RepID=A0A8S5NIZ8_9CAUD|nr:MAG TPA: protein of unknown function (DUF1830) [Siphoviridae sp. ctK0l2]